MRPNAPPLYSALVEAAMRLAARGHYHQFRKGSSENEHCSPPREEPLPPGCVPYMTHLMGTACILARLGASDTVLAAALLHDYLEDVPSDDGPEQVRAATGPQVLDLVLAVTEDKRRERDATETWEERKREQIARVAHMPSEAVLIKAADALHNLLSLEADLEQADEPEMVWQRLNSEASRQIWYFTSLAAAIRARLQDHTLVRELEGAVARLQSHI
ncbi:MAG: HD domain-containing protein [Acidobacteria bacterium]|jgi:(p)ppGpp synthase/HD superfamily hydrolase|nr:HD domain-containing protein [Acidobacteriota bacterium]